MSSVRAPYWPYTTPESKRELADSYRKTIAEYGNWVSMDPDYWDALATLQEQGRLDEWKATFAAWEDSRPHPSSLLAGS